MNKLKVAASVFIVGFILFSNLNNVYAVAIVESSFRYDWNSLVVSTSDGLNLKFNNGSTGLINKDNANRNESYLGIGYVNNNGDWVGDDSTVSTGYNSTALVDYSSPTFEYIEGIARTGSDDSYIMAKGSGNSNNSYVEMFAETAKHWNFIADGYGTLNVSVNYNIYHKVSTDSISDIIADSLMEWDFQLENNSNGSENVIFGQSHWDDNYVNGSRSGTFSVSMLYTNGDRGQLLGWADFGHMFEGEDKPVNPNPVPEPATMLSLAGLLVGVIGMRRKKS